MKLKVDQAPSFPRLRTAVSDDLHSCQLAKTYKFPLAAMDIGAGWVAMVDGTVFEGDFNR